MSLLKSIISDFISVFIESMSFLRDCMSSAKKCTLLLDVSLLSDPVGSFVFIFFFNADVVGSHGTTLGPDASFVN